MKKIKTLFINNKLIIIISFIAGLITHFYFYTNEVISPDALYIGNIHVSGTWETSLGRWGIHFIDILRGGLVNSFLITIICICCLTLATIILINLLDIQNSVTIILLSALMVVTPQVTETLMFIYSADAYCFAMLLSVLAVYFMYKKDGIKSKIYSVICIILTLSIYQAYIGVIVALAIIVPIAKILSGEELENALKKIGKSLIIGIIGVITYYLITAIILKITGNSFSTYGGANNIGISTLKNLIPMTLKTYRTFFQYFFGEELIYNQYWKRNVINFLIMTVTIVNAIYIIIKKQQYKNKINILIIGLLVIILPIGVNIINIIAPERDNNLTMGMSYVLIYVLVLKISDILKSLTTNKILNNTIQILIAIILITFVLSDNASYMARKEIYNNYYSTATRILTKIESYDGYNKNTKILIGGLVKYSPDIAKLGNGFISNDFETWANYDGVVMINKFLYNYIGTTINLCDKEDYVKIVSSEEYKNMDIFPYEECTKMIDGILVVKLEEEPTII